MSHPRKPGDLCPLRGSACDHGECETANACRLLDIKPAPAVPVECNAYLNGCPCHHWCQTNGKCWGMQVGAIRECETPAAMQSESATRKASPVWSGVLNYFPDALLAVARVSKAGNDKHNPGQPLHWSREKSNDHMDCAARHMLTPFAIDPDSREIHLANAAWRILAELQLYCEKNNGRS